MSRAEHDRGAQTGEDADGAPSCTRLPRTGCLQSHGLDLFHGSCRGFGGFRGEAGSRFEVGSAYPGPSMLEDALNAELDVLLN